MSHPYWPQPQYLYRRSVPTAPSVAAMGAFGQGESGNPYYGFGQFDVTVECDVGRYIDLISNNIGSAFSQIPGVGSTVASGVSSVIKSVLNTAGSNVIKEIFAHAGSYPTFVSKFVPAVKSWLEGVPHAVRLAVTVFLGQSPDAFVGIVAQWAYSSTLSFLNQCKEQMGTGTAPGGGTWVDSPVMLPIDPVALMSPHELMLEIQKKQGYLPTGLPSDFVEFIDEPPTVKPLVPTPTPTKGAGTAVAIGAAALAALLFLR